MTLEDIETIDDSYVRFKSIGELENYNNNQADTLVHMIGDKTIIAEVVQLLAYIRHCIANNAKMKIEVDIGSTVANPTFMLDVNGQQIPDLVAQDKIRIN